MSTNRRGRSYVHDYKRNKEDLDKKLLAKYQDDLKRGISPLDAASDMLFREIILKRGL